MFLGEVLGACDLGEGGEGDEAFEGEVGLAGGGLGRKESVGRSLDLWRYGVGWEREGGRTGGVFGVGVACVVDEVIGPLLQDGVVSGEVLDVFGSFVVCVCHDDHVCRFLDWHLHLRVVK